MIYQIEEIKVKKKRLVYVLALLLVLALSICMGVYAKRAVIEDKEPQNQIIVEEVEDEKKDYINDIKKLNFYDIVEDIYNGEEGKRVFLTFDDGPSESVTPHVLDILKQHNVKATFFVLGNRVSSNKNLIKRIYNEGHYIANHGYTHQYSKIYSSSSEVLKEYNKTEEAIRKALDMPTYSSSLFRFPGGSIGGEYHSLKQETKKVLKKKNIAYLDWNALTNDANGSNTRKKIMDSLKKTVKNKNNVVVLMHDAPDKTLTYKTLDEVINYLKDEGYAFKNIYDLIKIEE